MADPSSNVNEAVKIAEIRTKEAENATNAITQEEEDEKYKSEPTDKTSFKHYQRIFTYATKLDVIILTLGTLASIGSGVMVGAGYFTRCLVGAQLVPSCVVLGLVAFNTLIIEQVLPIMTIIFGKLVGNFQGFAAGHFSITSFNHTISNLAKILVYLFLGKFTFAYVAMYSFRVTGLRIAAAIRLEYLRALFSQSIGRLDKLPPGHAASTITTSANLLQVGISEKLSTCIQFTTLLITAYIIAFVYSWQLTLVASSILLFVLLVYGTIIPITLRLNKSFEHANSKAASIASEVFSSIRMVVACGAEHRVVESYSKWMDEARLRGSKMSPTIGIQLGTVFFGIYGDFAVTFWYGVKRFSEGKIDSVQPVIIVLFSVMMSVMSLANIIAPLTDAGKAAAAASTFFAMIDAPKVDTAGLRDPDVDVHKDISFRKVTFAYPSRPHVRVLDELDLTFETGKLTAIVGPSGSGKSTIVGLVERWYKLVQDDSDIPTTDFNDNGNDKTQNTAKTDPDKSPVILGGQISIGDHNLDSLDLKWWRSHIGLVQQEPFIFNDTIFNNVARGLVGSKFENEDIETKKQLVEEACKEAFADEFIARLPMGYNTPVGDSGIKLSGGQRQRLAIARSIIKQPMILIFDEATSSIDVRGERVVQEALDRVAKNRTTITIAHRLSTIRKADKIIVLAKGKAIEQGTHDELLADEDGVYYSLVHAQQLALGHSDDFELKKTTTGDSAAAGAGSEGEETEKKDNKVTKAYKNKGFFQSFGLLIVEQRRHFLWFLLTLLACLVAAGMFVLYSYYASFSTPLFSEFVSNLSRLIWSIECAAYPLQAYLMAKLILVFSEIGQKLLNDSIHWALMFVALACTTGFAYFVLGFCSQTLSALITTSYRQEYFENAIKHPISFFDAEENSSGTLTGRISNDPTQVQEMLGANMAMVLIAIFNMIGCLTISLAFGWKLTLVAFFGAVPFILVANFLRIRFELQFDRLNAAVFAESSQFAAEAIGASRTVASLTLEDLICNRYSELLNGQVNRAARKARYSQLVFALSDSIGLLCMALTFWYGSRLLISGEYNALQFFVIYTAMINGSESAGQWCSFGPNIAQASAAANRILSFRVRENSDIKPTLTKLLGDKASSHGGAEITFQNVHFRYPSRDIPIFAGLNLTIKKGQFAGLVGASGGGKTTVISLLEQFYQPQQGKITFDGANIADFDLVEYRKAISLVAQEPTLFQGTIKENIMLAVDAGTTTDAEMYTVCRDAEIHDFIMSLPDGYGTDIGSKGVALSGGQKQRIAIARALIRNPRVLLLDEATSSLDSESEKLVQAAFERAGKGRTMVVVAHRLATVQNADVVFVLGSDGDGTKVLEKGTHSELVARRSVYYQMCKSQALDR